MKKTQVTYTVFLMITVCLLIFLNSCDREGAVVSNDFSLEQNLITTIPDLGDTEINDVAVSGSTAYLLSDDTCYLYHFSDASVTQVPYGGSAVCADQNRLYVCSADNSTLLVYTLPDFTLAEEHPLDLPKESLLDIQGMLQIGASLMLDVHYLNPDGYSESHVFEYHTDKQTLTDHTPFFKDKDAYSLLQSMNSKDADTMVLVSVANTSFTNTIIKSYTYNFKKQTVEDAFIFDFFVSDCVYDGSADCYYFTDDSCTLKQYVPADDGISTIANWKKADIGEDSFIDQFFLVNHFILLFKNSSDVLAVTDTELPDDALRILAYDSIQLGFDLDKLISQYEQETSRTVSVTLYDSSVFKDILRTRLLSKEDDFDIVFIDHPTESNFLSAMINYALYAPLNADETICKNFEEMYPGIADMVRFQDAVIGVPYDLSISYLLNRTSASELHPAFDLTPEDVFAICETLADEETSVLFYEPYILNRFLADMVQSQILTGKVHPEEIEALLRRVKQEYDNGTLCLSDPEMNVLHKEKSVLFTWGPNFFDPFMLRSGKMTFPENGVAAVSFAGKKYVDVDGLAFINKYTANPEEAYAFIAMMTDRETIYSTGTGGIYPFTLLGKQLEENAIYSLWTEDELAYLSVLPQLYANAGIYTFDWYSLQDYINDQILLPFYAGTLSPEDAAKEIVTFVEYTYFE